jgi:hypothetical protein
MQIEQIIVRPEAKLILIQHTDSAYRSGVTVVPVGELSSVQVDALEVFLAFCRDKMPTEPDKPVPSEVEQEIAELEYRLEHLRKSLAVAVPVETVEPAVEEIKPLTP